MKRKLVVFFVVGLMAFLCNLIAPPPAEAVGASFCAAICSDWECFNECVDYLNDNFCEANPQ